MSEEARRQMLEFVDAGGHEAMLNVQRDFVVEIWCSDDEYETVREAFPDATIYTPSGAHRADE